MPRPTCKIKIVDEMYDHLDAEMKAQFDEAAKSHIKMVKYEKSPYLYTWHFKSEEDAQPLEDLLTKWELEYA